MRREDRIYTKEEARIKFNEIGNSIDHCVALPDMYRPLSNALSCQKRMLVKRTIESEVKKADKVIIRSLGNIYTNTALKYAQKYHKPYLVEVTGFACIKGNRHYSGCGRTYLFQLFFASTNYLKMQRHFPKVAEGNWFFRIS